MTMETSGYQIEWTPSKDSVTIEQSERLYDLRSLSEDLEGSIGRAFKVIVEVCEERALAITLRGLEDEFLDAKVGLVVRRENRKIIIELRSDVPKVLDRAKEVVDEYCREYGGLILIHPLDTTGSQKST